ncbi:MAG: NAD-binding protein [Burkholderiales bacterium]|nr:NAD-binding protein [Burkholderiales bacterium]
MGSVLLLTLRRIRVPIILLVSVYAVGIIGLVLIPGVDPQGRPWRMSIFHAFYFLSYTASTIGFGEIPHPFTDAQRLWVSAVIYMSVVGWAYMIARVLGLMQDRGFQNALTMHRFQREVRRLSESFYIVCGYGETGAILCRALDRMGLRFVVLDIEARRIDEVDLQGYATDVPALAGDVRIVANLEMAGIGHPYCRGVIAVTSDDHANLAAAISTKLLNPTIPVVCRAMTREVAQNMASFGTDHVINPFQRFGERLWLALHSPAVYRLLARLTGLPGTVLAAAEAPPHGRWIVCGYGRFGREIIGCFDREGLEATIIDPRAPAGGDGRRVVRGLGTEAGPLREAGAEQAVGIVAGTDNDVNNLSIAVTARELNPKLFVVLRQNLEANRPLFAAYKADMTMISAEIVAYQCLSIVATPPARPLSRHGGNARRGMGRIARRAAGGDRRRGGREHMGRTRKCCGGAGGAPRPHVRAARAHARHADARPGRARAPAGLSAPSCSCAATRRWCFPRRRRRCSPATACSSPAPRRRATGSASRCETPTSAPTCTWVSTAPPAGCGSA